MLLVALLIFFSMFIVHELGHYLTARHLDWEPKIYWTFSSGLWSGIGIETKELTINSVDEIYQTFPKLLIFSASGCIGIIPIIMSSYLLDDSALMWVAGLMLIYSLAETLHILNDFLTQCNKDIDRLKKEGLWPK